MSIHLEGKDLINVQQLEVAVHGPDGATHLIVCTGIAKLDPHCHETYTFLVGPGILRRQFVGVIASGSLSAIRGCEKSPVKDYANLELGADLISIDANHDDEANQVKVKVQVSSSKAITELAISYNVSILAELPDF